MVPGIAAGVPPYGVTVGTGTALNVIESKLPTAYKPFESITRRADCAPAASVTVRVTFCHVIQPPVLGTATGPVTSVPFISRWKVPPWPADATRNATVYLPAAATFTEYFSHS